MKPGLIMKPSTLHFCLILAWLPALVVAVAAYFAVLAPLTKKALLAETYGIARQLDETLMMRSIVLDMATDELKMEKLQEPAVLDDLLRSIRSHFPDFISLEVIDDEGTIVSMVGELSLSEEGLPSRANTAELTRSWSNQYRHAWTFRDDPASDSYYLTRERTETGGNKWFARARFARAPIQAAMDSPLRDDSLRVALVPVEVPDSRRPPESVARGTVRSSHKGGDRVASPRITGYRWAAAARAAAQLQTPGWQVTVEAGSPTTILWYGILFVVGLSLVHVLLAIRIVRRSRQAIRHESIPRGAHIPPILNPLAVHHDFRAGASDFQPRSEPGPKDLGTSQPLPRELDPILPGTSLDEYETAARLDELNENEPPMSESGRGTPNLPEFLEVEWSESVDAAAPQNRNADEDEQRFPEVSSFLTG